MEDPLVDAIRSSALEVLLHAMEDHCAQVRRPGQVAAFLFALVRKLAISSSSRQSLRVT
jgi:hypothetical protein